MNTHTVYHIRVMVDGLGVRAHTLRAATLAEAQERIKRAYPKLVCAFIGHKRAWA